AVRRCGPGRVPGCASSAGCAAGPGTLARPGRRDAPAPWTATRSRDVEEVLPDGVQHRFHAGVQLQLVKDVADVVLDGVLADEQLLGCRTVVEATRHQPQDFEFTIGEAGGLDR